MIVLPSGGRWALSRIVFDATHNAWVPDALLTRLSRGTCRLYSEPQSVVEVGARWGLVHIDPATLQTGPDTIALPELALSAPIGDGRVTTLKAALESRCPGYTYTDPGDGVVVAPALTARSAAWSASTRWEEVLQDLIAGYMRHGIFRTRAGAAPTHNTEFTDDFSTDPSSRWTAKGGTLNWDSGNGEIENTSGTCEFRYDDDPGSLEHESQVTRITAASGATYTGVCSVRMESSTTLDCYKVNLEESTGAHYLYRRVGGSDTFIEDVTGWGTINFSEWYTFRIAAEGTAGNDVDLDFWRDSHGSTKPSDPGWIGVDGSPDHEYTDSNAARLDASTHDHCGIAGNFNSMDERYNSWKSRAVSDRGAGGGTRPSGPYGGPYGRPYRGPYGQVV